MDAPKGKWWRQKLKTKCFEIFKPLVRCAVYDGPVGKF